MAQHTEQHQLVKLSDADDLRLEDRAQDIRGLGVYDEEGNQIGSVEDLYVDTEERKVRFLDVASGGFLGIGEKHFMIPVEAVTDVGDDGATIEQGAEKVMGSPPSTPTWCPQLPITSATSMVTTVTRILATLTPRMPATNPGRLRGLATKFLPGVERRAHGGRNRQRDDRPGAPWAHRQRTRKVGATPIGRHESKLSLGSTMHRAGILTITRALSFAVS